jgi:hypothetical protein
VNSARAFGPAAAGLLIVTVGTTPCVAVNAVSYFAVVEALLTIGPLKPTSANAHHRGGGVRAGLRYAASRYGFRSS